MNDGRVHLVDFDGFDVPCTERATEPEPDPTDANQWPASNLVDGWHWTISAPGELAAIEAEAVEALEALSDAPRPGAGDSSWRAMMEASPIPPVSGGSPEPYQPTADDWAEYAAVFDHREASDWPRDWTPEERAAAAADVAEFYRGE
jgi:hypothetical protein